MVSNPPPLPEVIDKIGLGFAQVRQCSCGGAVWIADGAELLLITTVTNAVGNAWDLSPMERGLVVTVVFIGVLFGNIMSGSIGDTYGRRFPIILSYSLIVLFSLFSSWSGDVQQLLVCRFLVGWAFGLGQPAYQTFQTEISPSYGRMLVQGLVGNFFIVGEVFSALLIYADDPSMTHLDWRWLLQAGCLPAALFGVIAYFFLYESPNYLAVQGDYEEAKTVLAKLSVDNGHCGMDVDFQVPEKGKDGSKSALREQLGIVFGWRLGPSTLIVMYSCFVLNFIYYGSLYAFPQVISEAGFLGSPALNLLSGAMWELVGNVVGLLCCYYCLRKTAMKVFLVTVTIAVLTFTAGTSNEHLGQLKTTALYAGYFGIKVFTNIGWLCIYQYATEIYPTEARATGTAVSLAGGRLASMSAPLVFELAQAETGSFVFFFHTIAAMATINMILVDFLPYETAGVALKDVLDADEPETQKMLPTSESYGSVR